MSDMERRCERCGGTWATGAAECPACAQAVANMDPPLRQGKPWRVRSLGFASAGLVPPPGMEPPRKYVDDAVPVYGTPTFVKAAIGFLLAFAFFFYFAIRVAQYVAPTTAPPLSGPSAFPR